MNKENEQLKDRLIDFESNYKQMEYCFRKTLIDQQYLMAVLSENELKGRPQIMRISEDLRFFLSALENKTGKILNFSHKFYKLLTICSIYNKKTL